jgi:hypothetical protein
MKLPAAPGTKATINNSTFTPEPSPSMRIPSGLGIGLDIGIGGALVFAIILFLVICRRNETMKPLRDETYAGKLELDGHRISKEAYAHEAQDD